ncbi:ADP-ribosylglycohydrolase family protein [Limnochorda pilosa]|uniref:Crystallin n=1 Tax=Limnochorda pilosa TaxID=1555112 RepID=A0A0K2SM81_LIMPI|nr:ADP-ribosylglycohydrolase family protein [Limnochorda pilosa]BAS28122.1 crystallin [Limnochorda pilosa]
MAASERTDLFQHGYGALAGLAVADALGASTEGSDPATIRATHGRITGFLTDDPAGTDDTEYAMLTAQILLKYGKDVRPEDVAREWTQTLIHQQEFQKGGFSEVCAVVNLRRGLSAPATGRYNYEMWSDGAAMRIAPVGVACAGSPIEAAKLAAIDASVSHHRDGIYCAQAVAAAVAEAMVADDSDAVIDAALAAIPQDSWSFRAIQRAVAIGRRYSDPFEALEELYQEATIPYYVWADMAPEATALAFGLVASSRCQYVPSVLGAANLGRDADTIGAIAGAISGAFQGVQAIPQEWLAKIDTVKGVCIHATRGMRVSEIARQLVSLAGRSWQKERGEG